MFRKSLVTLALVAVAAVGAPRVSTQVTVPGIDKPVVVVKGSITRDTLWISDYYYVLRGAVFVEEGATLTIEPGTTIVGELATRGTLVIAQGAKIIADGNAEAPIVFTSDQPVGSRARGDWGGLIINGRAPVNLPGGLGIGEGDTGVYGGDDPDDSSGVLRYVRVEYAGIEFSPDNELNGIAFQGVGRGTVVDYVQVKFNKDDGIEMFGGSVDIKHVVLTAIGDDSIDWTFGWNGRLQYAVVQQRGDDADRGIEADNNANNNDLEPRSNPTIYNLTLIGDPSEDFGGESTDGMRLREGTAGKIHNFIVTGFKTVGIDIRNASTLQQAEIGDLVLSHGNVYGNRRNIASGAAGVISRSESIVLEDALLVDPFNLEAPVFRPLPESPVVDGTLPYAVPPDDGFFEVAPFRGALSADPEFDWTVGWTDFSQG